MKIGILTFHRALNYGAILQTYALQKALKNLGSDVEVIDYRSEKIEKCYSLFQINSKNIVKVLASNTLYYSTRKKMRKEFEEFTNRNINLSRKKYLNIKELAQIKDSYDLLFTGSDQVWNDECTDFDKAYFLKFVDDNSKKASYAASFGFNCIPTKYVDDYKRLLQQYNYISVREKSGENIIQQLFKKDIYITLDPVFLLSKKEWISIIKPAKKKCKYILIYTIDEPNNLIAFSENLAKKMNCELIYLNDRFKKNSNAKYIKSCSPIGFLDLFANAEYVVTNSFHGTAFSILFEKEFYSEVISKSFKNNHRVIDLLKLLNLKDRIIDNADITYIKNTYIDYENVNNILEKEIQHALNYLKKLSNGSTSIKEEIKNE